MAVREWALVSSAPAVASAPSIASNRRGCCPDCTLHDAICYGRLWQVLQVLMPGIAFGLAHASYLNQGFLVWLAIMLPTALPGMLWGVAYLLRRRSLVPTIVAHFLNDATESPWGYFRGGNLP